MDRDHALELLGISRADASDPGALRRAFRSRLREVHPDLNPGQDAAEMTYSITQAYRLLVELPAHRDKPGTRAAASTHRAPPSPDARGRSWTEGHHRLAVEVIDESSILVAEDRETTFSAVLGAAHSLGEIGYLDRSAWLIELIVEFVEAPTSSVVMTLQGRSSGTEVFCSVEPLSGGDSPPTGAVTNLIARTLSDLRTTRRDG